MADRFDPYLSWFGIPVDQRPPTHYQLLNLSPFESDTRRIESQVQQVLGFLHNQTSTFYRDIALTLIAHIETVRQDLLDPERKAAYDAYLRGAPAGPAPIPGAFAGPAPSVVPASAVSTSSAPASTGAGPSSPFGAGPAPAGGAPNPYSQPAANPYSAPSQYGSYGAYRDQGQPGGAERLRLASRWQRLGAAMIELVIFVVHFVAASLLLFTFENRAEIDELARAGAAGQQELGMRVMAYFALVAIPWLLTSMVMLTTMGQTIGKYLVGIRIVRISDAQPPGFWRGVVLRWWIPSAVQMIDVIGGIFALVDILFIFGEERRCLHDYLAGTTVVEV